MAYRVVKCPKGRIAEVTDYGLNKCVICPRTCPEKDCRQKNFRLVKKFYTVGLKPEISVRDDTFASASATTSATSAASVPPTPAPAARNSAESAPDPIDESFGDVFFDEGFDFEDDKSSSGLGYSPLGDLDEPEDKSASGLEYSPFGDLDDVEDPEPIIEDSAGRRTEKADGKTAAASAKFRFLRNPNSRNPLRESNVIENSTEALTFMLRYWQVNRFLSRNGQELTADGENTVLDYGGGTVLKKVREICVDPEIVDRNEKFFCIYYRVLFPQLQRGLLYYYDGDDYGDIPPICRSADDFFDQIKTGGSLSRNLGKMLLPLSVYFGLGGREELYDYISAEMFSRYGILYVYAPDENAFCNLGKVGEFVRELPAVCSYDETYRKYAALMRIKIRKTDRGSYVPEKGDGLYGLRKEGVLKPDDRVFALLGIRESSRSLGIYSMWICLLRAHAVMTDSAEVRAGGAVYSKNDIYDKFVLTVKEAFEAGRAAEFFLLRSLLANGVLSRFVERSEAVKTEQLAEKIVDSESLEDCYYYCDGIEHLLRDGSKTVGISEYVESLLTGGAGYTAVKARLERDENLRVWINARKRKYADEFSAKAADLDKLAAECERIYGKRKEI